MFPFEIDETSDIPIWVQLRQRIAYLINSGYFEISINYNTVNKAYISLVSDGYLESTRGRGVFVADVAGKFDDEELGQVEEVIDEFIATCRDLGMGFDDIEKAVSRHVKKLRFEHEHDGESSVPGGKIIDFSDVKKTKRNATGV